jgi:hypothetical protein
MYIFIVGAPYYVSPEVLAGNYNAYTYTCMNISMNKHMYICLYLYIYS